MPGILAAEQLGVAHVDPARLDARAGSLTCAPIAELGLEQDAAAECDLVGAVMNFVGRAVVDRDAEAGPDVDPAAEFRRQADRGITGVRRRVLSAPNT